MSTSATPIVATPAVSELQKIWNWIKAKAVVVEADLAKILGSKTAADLEAIGKTLLDSWIGPLATAAITVATDVITGQMSVSKAVDALVTSAEANGKTVTKAAALQVIALAQNTVSVSVPGSTDSTVTPVA
jgi:hypothetical protein